MSRSNDAGHFFQTSDALATGKRKAAKAKNKHGNPIQLPSKVLAAIKDPNTDGALYVAEAAGEVKRIDPEVCKSVSPRYYDVRVLICSRPVRHGGSTIEAMHP